MRFATLPLLAACLSASSTIASPMPQQGDKDDAASDIAAPPSYEISCPGDADRLCTGSWNGNIIIWQCPSLGKPKNPDIPTTCSECRCVARTGGCGMTGGARLTC